MEEKWLPEVTIIQVLRNELKLTFELIFMNDKDILKPIKSNQTDKNLT